MGIERKRLGTILEALRNGVTNSDDILSAVHGAQIKAEVKLGSMSESHFDRHAPKWGGWVINLVEKATKNEDHLGIDRWVIINRLKMYESIFNVIKDGRIPVQVKSSDQEVEKFREDPRYKETFNKLIIVINSNPHTTRDPFKKRLFAELKRISKVCEDMVKVDIQS